MKIYLSAEKGLLYGLGAYFIYVFWFQYAVMTVNGFLPIIAIVLVTNMLAYKKINLYEYKKLMPVLLFLIVTIIGVIFALDRQVTMNLFFLILQYCIPMIAIYMYVGTSVKNMSNLMWIISISVALLAFAVLTNGVETNTGAITLGGLNSNTLSGYILLGTGCTIYLLCGDVKGLEKICLNAVLCMLVVAQFDAASRRGVVVLLFLILTYFHTLFDVKLKKKKSTRFVMVCFVLIGLVAILVNMAEIMSKFAVFDRFFGGSSVGDALRKNYQEKAWELFCENPIWGKGLGSVSAAINQHSHSLYYELLATTGVLGTGLILSWMVYIIYKLILVSKKTSAASAVLKAKSRCFMWNTVSILISGIAVTYIYDTDFYILLGLICAWLHCVSAIRKKDQQGV